MKTRVTSESFTGSLSASLAFLHFAPFSGMAGLALPFPFVTYIHICPFPFCLPPSVICLLPVAWCPSAQPFLSRLLCFPSFTWSGSLPHSSGSPSEPQLCPASCLPLPRLTVAWLSLTHKSMLFHIHTCHKAKGFIYFPSMPVISHCQPFPASCATLTPAMAYITGAFSSAWQLL